MVNLGNVLCGFEKKTVFFFIRVQRRWCTQTSLNYAAWGFSTFIYLLSNCPVLGWEEYVELLNICVLLFLLAFHADFAIEVAAVWRCAEDPVPVNSDLKHKAVLLHLALCFSVSLYPVIYQVKLMLSLFVFAVSLHLLCTICQPDTIFLFKHFFDCATWHAWS